MNRRALQRSGITAPRVASRTTQCGWDSNARHRLYPGEQLTREFKLSYFPSLLHAGTDIPVRSSAALACDARPTHSLLASLNIE
jgi:hypothetical protein